MDFRTPREIGRLAGGTRRFYRLKQTEVARAVGVSRQWIGDLEAGKPTLELGLVLRTLEELGLDVTVKRSPTPPPWTVPLTLAAELRESGTIYGARRRAHARRQRNEALHLGNLEPDPVIDKNWQAQEDERFFELVKGMGDGGFSNDGSGSV